MPAMPTRMDVASSSQQPLTPGWAACPWRDVQVVEVARWSGEDGGGLGRRRGWLGVAAGTGLAWVAAGTGLAWVAAGTGVAWAAAVDETHGSQRRLSPGMEQGT
jgi:hypothetical protein